MCPFARGQRGDVVEVSDMAALFTTKLSMLLEARHVKLLRDFGRQGWLCGLMGRGKSGGLAHYGDIGIDIGTECVS